MCDIILFFRHRNVLLTCSSWLAGHRYCSTLGALLLFRTTLTAKAPRNLATMARFSYIQKAPARNVRGLPCNRQQSILPGRFQPSTFDAWELNCCVRDGNRWDLSAIVTGSLNRLFVFPLRQDCLSQPFLAASTKILVQVNVFSDLQNFTEETTYKPTCLHSHSQIKPSTD